MKTLTTFTLTALIIASLNDSAFAGKIHDLDDINGTEHQNTSSISSEMEFTGRGQKVGGDKYAYHLFGISNEEGKRLVKLSKKHKGDDIIIEQKIKKMPFAFVYMKTKFSSYIPPHSK
tara:strand:+ start:1051 stop:1404 length:354 start_codon:yes stop_codon:yes gene_type:complete